MDAALLFFAWVWHALTRGGGATGTWQPAPSAPPDLHLPWPESIPILPSSAPPWPQVVPTSSLPTFPGPAWEFDEPPPPEVQQRAGQLVRQLWQLGKGAHRIEHTAGRWIAYRAELVASGRQGVVAYRIKRASAPRVAPPTRTTPRAPAPRVVPAATSSSAPPRVVPLLKYGDGLKPQPPNPAVRMVQERLGIAPADGRFGPATRAAVQAFQRSRGLTPDGIVGPQTHLALLGVVRT